MNKTQAYERIGWLETALAAQRGHMAKILLRLKEIGCRAGVSLGLHRKFMRLMEQIAVDRQKELDLINEIEQVEKRHLEMKKANKLRHAGYRPAPVQCKVLQPDQPKPKKSGILAFVAFLAFFSPKPDKP